MPKVSVIIPVYNTEKYLPACLKSVAGQSHSDLEIICINDGSTDDSGQILADYASKDPRFVLITQENQGQGAARNRGIERATGDYILFVDSDDRVHPQAVEILLTVAQKTKAPLAMSDAFLKASKNQEFVWHEAPQTIPFEISKRPVDDMLKKKYASSFVWNKLYKKELFQNWRFIEGIKFEDWPLITCLFSEIPFYAVVNVPLYFYNDTNISTIRSPFSSKKMQDYLTGIRFVFHYYQAPEKQKFLTKVRKYRICKSITMMIGKIYHNKGNWYLIDEFFQNLHQLRAEKMIAYRDFSWKILFRILYLKCLKKRSMETITVKNAADCPDTTANVIVRGKIDFKPLLSLIIPVYNAENYLVQCLDSVLNHPVREMEIICVDDGSADNSLSVLQTYAAKDARITVLAQKNLHAGVARNAGLSVAKGEYVGFLDADDWITPHGLELVLSVAVRHKPDMIKFASTCWDNERKAEVDDPWFTLKNFAPHLFNKDLTFRKQEKLLKLPNCPWSGIYRREFLYQNDIFFDDLLCGNDVSFFVHCLLKARKIRLVDETVVFYRINNPKSLISIRNKNFDCMYRQYEIIGQIIAPFSATVQRQMRGYVIAEIIDRFHKYFADADDQTKNAQFEKMKSFLTRQAHIKFSEKLQIKIKKFIQADRAEDYFSAPAVVSKSAGLLDKKVYRLGPFRLLTKKVYSNKTVWKLF